LTKLIQHHPRISQKIQQLTEFGIIRQWILEEKNKVAKIATGFPLNDKTTFNVRSGSDRGEVKALSLSNVQVMILLQMDNIVPQLRQHFSCGFCCKA
jgi:hypothetical protein